MLQPDEEAIAIEDDDDARIMAPLLANLDPEDWEDLSAYA